MSLFIFSQPQRAQEVYDGHTHGLADLVQQKDCWLCDFCCQPYTAMQMMEMLREELVELRRTVQEGETM